MSRIVSSFFHILSCIINETAIDWSLFHDYSSNDWEKLFILSKKQGVSAIIFDRIKDIPQDIAPPRQITLKWLSLSLAIEKQMKSKENIAIEFANRLAEQNIPVVVLKGISYASFFPNPHHRESGDLDCYLMGQKELGDELVIKIGGKMKEAGYKHSHLYYNGLTIENHRFLTSFDNSKLGIKTERILQGLIKNGLKPIDGSNLMNPCADFNALFLLKHAQRHFIKEGICTRHLLDWAFFLKAEATNVNWQRVIPIMQECRISNFAKAISSICIKKLGTKIDIKELQEPCTISDAVIADILGDHPDLFHENLWQKAKRILRRFYRMWKFKSLADENYLRLVWNSFTFNSYIKREPHL